MIISEDEFFLQRNEAGASIAAKGSPVGRKNNLITLFVAIWSVFFPFASSGNEGIAWLWK
ncbi:hypothetical protein D3C80_1702260 [compost metagenome]